MPGPEARSVTETVRTKDVDVEMCDISSEKKPPILLLLFTLIILLLILQGDGVQFINLSICFSCCGNPHRQLLRYLFSNTFSAVQ